MGCLPLINFWVHALLHAHKDQFSLFICKTSLVSSSWQSFWLIRVWVTYRMELYLSREPIFVTKDFFMPIFRWSCMIWCHVIFFVCRMELVGWLLLEKPAVNLISRRDLLCMRVIFKHFLSKVTSQTYLRMLVTFKFDNKWGNKRCKDLSLIIKKATPSTNLTQWNRL